MKKVLLIFLITYMNSSAATIYVNASATGSNNGLSWNNAYTNLQEALSNAIFGDQIWVAAGTYKATSTTDRTLSFSMKNGVNLYGGFNGTETALGQRTISSNPTTLSGDIGAIGDNIDNTNTILKVFNITSGLTIDGFRIISGNTSNGCGGIYFSNNTGLFTISNCFFYNNIGNVGSAVLIGYQGNATVSISNCDFNSNTSISGTIFCDSSSTNNLNLDTCRFRGSVSSGEAVLRFLGASLAMEKCVITNNTTSQSNLLYIDANVGAKISNSLIVGNSYHESAIAFYSSSSIPQIVENVTIAHNKKTFVTNTFYTTIYSINGVARVYNSIVYENTNSSTNSQINLGNQSGTIVANSIVENGFATGTAILNTNPLFMNPNNLISAPFDCTNYNYKLQNSSPGINYGDNTYVTTTQDLEGGIRIQQTTVDTGAYENITDLNNPENVYVQPKMMYRYNEELLVISTIDNGEIYIYDMNGKLVESRAISNSISLSHLKSGLYFIAFQNEILKILKP
jgi:hypothetical protein